MVRSLFPPSVRSRHLCILRRSLVRHTCHAHLVDTIFFSHTYSHPLVHHPEGVLLVDCVFVSESVRLTPSVSAGTEEAAAETRPRGKRGKKGRTVLLSGGLNF